jgi:ribosomal protein L40E
MKLMERIGWWFMRHSKPQREYIVICPKCGVLNPSGIKRCRNCRMEFLYQVKIPLDELGSVEKWNKLNRGVKIK